MNERGEKKTHTKTLQDQNEWINEKHADFKDSKIDIINNLKQNDAQSACAESTNKGVNYAPKTSHQHNDKGPGRLW